MEEGTHDSLLADKEGSYWALVNAQKLSIGEHDETESDLIEEPKIDLLQREPSAAGGDEVLANLGANTTLALVLHSACWMCWGRM